MQLQLSSVTDAPGGAQLLRTHDYDTNPLDSTGTFSQNALGRLTAVQYPAQSTIQMNEMYSYSQAGLPTAKRLQVNQLVAYDDINNHLQHQTVTVNLDSTYTYNDEGQATAMTYPSTIGVLNVVTPGPSYNYSYDSMNRLGGMTDSNNNTIVSGVSYDAANRLLTMAFSNVNENRNYNVLGQLTQIWAPNVENILYNYPTGANNGKVSSMYNAVSGETVTYAYDSLNRMATASGSGWAETYTLDPYGNLTTKHVTSGSGPSLSVSVNPGNNQLQGYGFNYDANGNAINSSSATPLAYDAENRLTGVGWNNQAPAVDYCYDAQNKRIFLWTAGTVDSFSNVYNYSVVFYSPSGQKLGTYLLAPQQPVFQPNGINTPYVTVSRVSSDQYFGGRRLAAMDQLGSAGTYYPWGEAKGSTNPQDTWSYATYWRDSATGLDYANNRYYSNAYGRFMTPDPYQASGGPGDPQSWNRYSYTRGDPVNRADPRGTDDCDADFCDDVWSWGDPFDGFWDIAGPFNNGPSFGYACMFGFIPGCNPYQGGSGGGGLSASDLEGISTAQNGAVQRGSDNFDEAFSALMAALLDVAIEFSPGSALHQNCEKDLTALGVTDAQISLAASTAVINNGVTSTANYAQAISGNSAAYNANAFLYGSTTISQYMAMNPGTVAVSQAPGNNIYIDAGWVNGFGAFDQEALMLHELIHNITGNVDSVIQGQLGLLTNVPSQNIANKLGTDCLR